MLPLSDGYRVGLRAATLVEYRIGWLNASARRLQSQRFALRNTCQRLSHRFVRRNHRRIANRSPIFISCTALSHLLAYPIAHRCESNS